MTADASTRAVLLVSHGSRVAESNTEIENLAARVAGRIGPDTAVTHAFLEMARPSIAEAIDALVRSGTRRIVLIPYFLSAGRHVAEDIPAIVEEARVRHPGLDIEITGHFGAQERVPELLAGIVKGGSKP